MRRYHQQKTSRYTRTPGKFLSSAQYKMLFVSCPQAYNENTKPANVQLYFTQNHLYDLVAFINLVFTALRFLLQRLLRLFFDGCFLCPG